MSTVDNLKRIKAELPSEVTILPISKTHTPEQIMEVYEGGNRIFGENKVNELVEKYELLPKDIDWHLVGHLQRNKVKYVAPFVSLIHSVDSIRLLLEINKMAQKNERIINCLLQVRIAEEDTKYGLTPDELKQTLSSEAYKNLTHVKVVGLMGMATFTDDMEQVRKEFRSLSILFNDVKSIYFDNSSEFSVLSMGMSGDYGIAVEEGSTMVRIGSVIFGDRLYCKK